MIRLTFLFIILFSSTYMVVAQPGNPGPNPFIPIDGGILYLLAAGLGYGFYEIKKKIRGSKYE